MDLDDTDLTGCELIFKQLNGKDGKSYAIADLCSWLKFKPMRKLLLSVTSDAHKLNWKEVEPVMKNIQTKYLRLPDFGKHLDDTRVVEAGGPPLASG